MSKNKKVKFIIDAYEDRTRIATGLLNSGYKVSFSEEEDIDFPLSRKVHIVIVEDKGQ